MPGTNTVAYWFPFVIYEENEMLWTQPQRSYSQHVFFFVTYKWPQEARVLQYTSLEMRAMDKHYSLLDPFVSYENDDLLWIQPQRSYSQHLFFFITYEWAQEAGVLQ